MKEMQAVVDLNGHYLSMKQLEWEEQIYFRSPPSNSCKLLKRISPHICLQLLVISYLLFGGAVFYYLESGNEVKERESQMVGIFKLRDNFHSRLWTIKRIPNKKPELYRKQIAQLGRKYFEQLAIKIAVANKKMFLNENYLLKSSSTKDKDDKACIWSFNNSLFYAAAILTVIGYGGQNPATAAGRSFSVFYVLFGYPILLVAIADIAKIFKDCLNALHKICDQISKNSHPRRMSRVRCGSRSSIDLSDEISKSVCLCKSETLQTSECAENKEIPILLLLLIFTGFLNFGAFIVQKWRDWSYWNSLFYCFMTTAKIGYENTGPTGTLPTIAALVYTIVGLAIAVTCIDSAGTIYIRTLHQFVSPRRILR
uniref:Potassium channel domain-containing protein n=1 Tax=Ditylenchus dipsaci TaxID=166011 RepID=A0A915D4I9_9BILA